MVDYISCKRVHHLIDCLAIEVLWEHHINSIQLKVKTHMIQTSTDKNILDKVPTSSDVGFHTIANAGLTLKNERGRETYNRTEFQHRVDRAVGTKEKEEANKLSGATKKDNTKRMEKKKAKPKSQITGAKSDKSNTIKKAKEPGKELVTYALKKV